MKNCFSRLPVAFKSYYCLGLLAVFIAAAGGLTVARATSETWADPSTSLLKGGSGGNWGGSLAAPTTGTTGVIGGNGGRPLGWNGNTNPGPSTFGDLDFISDAGASDLVIGNYTTAVTSTNVNITLGGSTLGSTANTVIGNSSGDTIVFENDVVPSGDLATNTGLTTYTLGNATNAIQATASSNIIIDNVITGTGDALTFLGGGSSSATGATLELGAGSANDVAGGLAPNAPAAANGGTFSGSPVVQSSDVNSFTGGLTVGDPGASSTNSGVVQIDGANALPATGTVTVNTNSQLVLNGTGNYGGAAQFVVLNGPGTTANNGALVSSTGAASTWQGNINVSSTSSINVGTSGSLAVTGSLTGSALLQITGAGALALNGNSSAFSGGFLVNSGSLVAGNSNALGSGTTSVSGGTLSSSVGTTSLGALTLSTGVLAVNQSAFDLATGQDFTMSGGTFDLTYAAGSTGSISSAGGVSDFLITSGTLNLGGSAWNYATTYNILSGFGSGTVSGLAITNYNTSAYTANVNNAGVLSFSPVPEPSTWAAMLCGLATLVIYQSGRKRRRRALNG